MFYNKFANTGFSKGLSSLLFSQVTFLGLFYGCMSPETTINPQQISRPNILWITCEDMSPRLGAYGDSVAYTPNIDKLAKESVLFTNAFSISGVCAPCRAALIMGLYPTSFGALHMRTIKRTSAISKITDPALLAIPVYEALPPYYPDNEIIRADLARHYDNIRMVDRKLGQLLAELEASGEADNTIVFFFGDHGDGLPRAKRWIYDSGLLEGTPALWFEKQRPELEFYDTWEDPHEVNNLADAPEHAERIGTMLSALTSWEQKTGDMGGIPEPELVKRLWPPDGIQPTTEKCTFKIVNGDKIELKSETEGTSLAYQVINLADTSEWEIYSEPVDIREGQIRAIAHRIGFKPSAVITIDY